jgi:hypothetical protein
VSGTESRWSGRRLVVLLYVVILGITGSLGLVLGASLPVTNGPKLLFLISLPPTPLGFALFGVVTVGIALGIPLALVAYFSRRLDPASVAGKET